MLHEIRELANELGLSDGGLLKLAKEIAQDGVLVSVGHMRAADQALLRDFLQKALTYERQGVLVS